jgi:sortase A
MGDELSLFSAKLPPRRRRHGLVVLERVLLLVALCTLGYVAATLGGAALYQKYESRQLDEILRSGPPPAAGSGTVTLGPRRIIGRIEVPRLGVSTIIKEGDDARTLDLAVGHIRGTALPGGRGNIGLAGHRDTFFRRLQHIETGDVIRLVAPEGTFTYLVERTQVVSPKDVWVLDATAEPSLTLVTCYPFSYVGTAPERFIVRARLTPGSSPPVRLQAANRMKPAGTASAVKPPRPKPSVHKVSRPTAGSAKTHAAAPKVSPRKAAPVTPPAARAPQRIVWLHTLARGH